MIGMGLKAHGHARSICLRSGTPIEREMNSRGTKAGLPTSQTPAMLHSVKTLILRSWTLVLPLLCVIAHPVQAAAVNVRIVGLSTASCAHDVSAIGTHLNSMLAATSGYSGSSAAATVFSGRSLMEAYYHPTYRTATRTAVTGDYDYLVILPETEFLYSYPEMTFDSVLQMSRKALEVGTTPLLLMPGTGNTSYVATLGTNSYRIANGCGIHAIPGGYAAQSANLLSITTNQAYLLAATIFTKITGLNATSGTSYVPASVSNYSSLAGTAVTSVNTHNGTTHYTTSRENSGLVRYRNITPANNSLRFMHTGTSTERGIRDALIPIFQASGYSVPGYYYNGTWGWTSAMATAAEPTFAANPNEYILGFVRSPFVEVNSSTMTSPNQPNLLPICYDQQYTGMSNTGTLEDIHELTNTARGQCLSYGFSTVPIHLGAARLNDVDSSLVFSGDGTHWNAPFYNMIAAMMATTSLGRVPTPTTAILADANLLKGFNVGKQLVRQLAFLSETESHCPDTSLSIAASNAPGAYKGLAYNHTFTATGGTPPYIWSEESSVGLPAGLTLSSSGQLSGIVTADPGTWQLVIHVKDSNGAIRRAAKTLTVTTLATGPNAYLNILSPSLGTLSPQFSSETYSYTASVLPSQTSMTVTPTAVVPAATIRVNGSIVASGSPSGAISLSIGSNVITTQVTSQDLSSTKTYTLTVTRPTPSTNANLSNLVPSAGTLSPSFASGTLSYTASVPFGADTFTLTPTAAETYAIIKVNGTTVISGTPSSVINLNVGSNVITVEVRSSDLNVTKTYTLTVTRAAAVSRWWDGGSSNIATTGDGASQGGATGVWNTTTQNWDQGNGLAHVAWNNTDGNIAIFGGTGGTVTTGNVTVGGMTLASACTLDGGTITIPNAATISNSATVVVNSAIAGSGGITKTGAGTLSFGTATNTYSRGTTISAGTVNELRGNSLGTGPIMIDGNSTLSPAYGAYPVFANPAVERFRCRAAIPGQPSAMLPTPSPAS
jgi:autotransporter-associated beta strand protein